MKLKIICSCLLLLIMSSCGSKKSVRNKKDTGVVITESKPLVLPSVNEVTLIKKLARKNPKLSKKTLAYIHFVGHCTNTPGAVWKFRSWSHEQASIHICHNNESHIDQATA